jgi:hypothetical protein
MNKAQKRDLLTLCTMHKLGGYEVNIARGLSALIRSAMSEKSKTELIEYAEILQVSKHPEFRI